MHVAAEDSTCAVDQTYPRRRVWTTAILQQDYPAKCSRRDSEVERPVAQRQLRAVPAAQLHSPLSAAIVHSPSLSPQPLPVVPGPISSDRLAIEESELCVNESSILGEGAAGKVFAATLRRCGDDHGVCRSAGLSRLGCGYHFVATTPTVGVGVVTMICAF